MISEFIEKYLYKKTLFSGKDLSKLQKFFYRPPQTLGEGLARIKKGRGINARFSDWNTKPAKRNYVSSKNVIKFNTDRFTTEHKCLDEGVKSWTDTSRLIITDDGKQTQYIIDYNTNHDNVGREVTPYRYRTITKKQLLDYNRVSSPTITLL